MRPLHIYVALVLLVCIAVLTALTLNWNVWGERKLSPSVLHDAIRRNDVSQVHKLFREEKLNPMELAHSEKTPLYVLTETASSETPQMELMTAVLMDYLIDGNVGYTYHPLTNAMKKGFRRVAAQILKSERTVPEVFAKDLACPNLPALPAYVVLVVGDGEDRDCMSTYPNSVSYANSRLMAHLHSLSRESPYFNPSTVGGVFGKDGFVEWDDLTGRPPYPHMPPRDMLVMTPHAFEDVVEALGYYFFGPPWSLVQEICYVAMLLASWVLSAFILRGSIAHWLQETRRRLRENAQKLDKLQRDEEVARAEIQSLEEEQAREELTWDFSPRQ